MEYLNPILKGFYPDPSICRVENDYYLVTSSFAYYPGVPIFHSNDLVNWKQIGHVLDRTSQLLLEGQGQSGGIFAPTIRYNNGVFYMITTNVGTNENFYVTATDPAGSWSDPVYLKDWPGIDPSLLFDKDGKVYITGKSDEVGEESGIYQAELDISTGQLLSERVHIWSGTGGQHPEAPHLYNIHGIYYLMIAEGGTEYGHMVTIARSEKPFGPFESNVDNPILSHRSTDKSIQATGHADLVEYHDGSWWALFLGIRPVGYPKKHHLGRETFLAEVTWTDDGWPVIGENGIIEERMSCSHLVSQYPEKSIAVDHFDSNTLDIDWNYLKNPYKENYSLHDKTGYLALSCSTVTLNDLDSPSFVGKRQRHFDCDVSTRLEFTPKYNGDEAGLTVFMNERYHYEICLTMINDIKQIIVRKRIGDVTEIASCLNYSADEIILGIKSNKKTYQFYCDLSPNDKEENVIAIGNGECGFLSSEVAGGFTGVYFGLYATGREQKQKNKAYFDWFKYTLS